MAESNFEEQFSLLAGALQEAVLLTRAASVHAREDLETADRAYLAVRRAVEILNDMRPRDGQEGGNG